MRGCHQEAAAEFAQAPALSPNYADALANQGMAMMSLGHDTAALASLGRALQLQPGHGDALRRAALLSKKYGLAGEAVPLFERAIAPAASDNGRSGVKPLKRRDAASTPLRGCTSISVNCSSDFRRAIGPSSNTAACWSFRPIWPSGMSIWRGVRRARQGRGGGGLLAPRSS